MYTGTTYWIACNSNGATGCVDLDLLSLLLEMWSLEMAADGGGNGVKIEDDTSIWTGVEFLFGFDRTGMRLGVIVLWPVS